jgi:hypothetical protein
MGNRFLSSVCHHLRLARHALEITGIKCAAQSLSFVPEPDAATRELFLAYSQRARAQGFDRLYVLMSFDCDTPEDIPAAEQLDMWLRERNIPATYAVPGAMLQQGAEVYRRIADAGAEFINHGALPHTERRDGRYWSVTFYHEMSPYQVAEDIQRGHEIVKQVIGKTPVGFRAPHFGNFQKPEQREMIYAVLREFGYGYSSSTLPELGFQHGPVVDVGGLWEVPLSGTIEAPYSVFDSWSHVVSPYKPVVREEYGDLFIRTLARLLELEVCGVLNYYVDPAHIVRAPAFYCALEFMSAHGVPAICFDQVLRVSAGSLEND